MGTSTPWPRRRAAPFISPGWTSIGADRSTPSPAGSAPWPPSRRHTAPSSPLHALRGQAARSHPRQAHDPGIKKLSLSLVNFDLVDFGEGKWENEQLSKYGDTKSARAIMLAELKKLIEAKLLFHNKLQFPDLKNSRLRTLINQRFGLVNRLYMIAGGGRRVHGDGAAQVIGEFLKELKIRPVPVVSASVFRGPRGCTYKAFRLIERRCEGN